MLTHGTISSYGFDLRNCVFTLSLEAPSSSGEGGPTEVFLPEFHFPQGGVSVEVSGGKWTISMEDSAAGPIQMLKWWHAEGDQTITVTGVKGTALGSGDEEGYIEQCQQTTGQKCVVM